VKAGATIRIERALSAMVQILRNKNLTTRFQILVEVAANQPNIQQKDIARKLGITSQAVSEYVNGLVNDGWLASDGRSRYRVTREGVNWVLKAFRELGRYSSFVEKAVTNITVCAAIADCDLSQGQVVGLEMKDGLLFATGVARKGVKGVATSDASKGEDVGVSDIEGMVELAIGKLTILKVPDIQSGGSKQVDLARLERELKRRGLIGAIGIEALAALRRIGLEPHYFYGVTEAAIEAARSSLPFLIVCVDDEVPHLLTRLGEESLSYELVDLMGGEETR